MIDLRIGCRSSRDYLLNVGLLTLFLIIAVASIAFADDKMLTRYGMEEILRLALVKSLEGQVAQICEEMLCEPPSVSVAADLSEVLRAFPEKLATSPTVRCHRVPCIAITSDNWAHLAEVYTRSDERVRHMALEVGLSREEDAMTVSSASVKSVEDYGSSVAYPAINGKNEFSFDLCGVDLSLKTSRARDSASARRARLPASSCRRFLSANRAGNPLASRFLASQASTSALAFVASSIRRSSSSISFSPFCPTRFVEYQLRQLLG